jgi:hypothetical protein
VLQKWRAVTVTAAILDNHYIYHVIARALGGGKKPSRRGAKLILGRRRVYFQPGPA